MPRTRSSPFNMPKRGEPQTGDIVTVKIPASLIPQSHFKTVDGKLSVDSVKPIQVKYASSVKKVALDNLFTPGEGHGAQGLHRA